ARRRRHRDTRGRYAPSGCPRRRDDGRSRPPRRAWRPAVPRGSPACPSASTVGVAWPGVKPLLRRVPKLRLTMNGMRIVMVLGLALAGCTSSHGGDQPPPSARAGFGGPSSAVKDVDELMFHTPSKNIFCSLTPSAVRCDIAHKSWQPPAKP